MRSHRTIWAIAVAAAALAAASFAVRHVGERHETGPSFRGTAAERDALVARMMERLDMDPRVRSIETRRLVEAVARFSTEPVLATAESWYAEGLRAFYGQSNPTDAELAFKQSAKLRPDWAWPVNGLAIVEFSEGRRGDAMRDFDRALSIDPRWSRPHADMAILYRRAGDLNEAFNHALEALRIEPDHPVNHFNYGVMLDELGRHAEARAEYERVLAAVPDMPQAAYNLACSFAREADAPRAVEWLKRAVAQDAELRGYAAEDPDFIPIKSNREFASLVHDGPAQ